MTQKTLENLSKAFAAAALASARQKVYAMKARAEGRVGLARLFDAASESASVQARRCLRLMRGRIGTTEDNLKMILEQEIPDLLDRYGEYLEVAKAEAAKVPVEVFTHTSDVVRRVQDMLLRQNEPAEQTATAAFYVCQVCGYVASDAPPDRCPVCNAVRSKFRAVKD